MTYTGIVHGLEERLYHSQPELSSTGAKKILKSPAHYQWYITHPHETKDSFDLGSAVHAKVLGVGAEIAVYPDGSGPETFEYEGVVLNTVLSKTGALGTNASKAFEAAARKDGKVPVKRVTARVVDRIAESVLGNQTARALFEGGEPEVSIFATDPDTGVGLRGRLDYLRPATIADLKTTAGEASESGFSKTVFNFGYHVQFALYEHIYELITGDRLPWLWVVVETEAPYVTSVFALGEDEQKMGRDDARRAIDTYARCRDTGIWPAYRHANTRGGAIGLVKAPTWSIYEYIDAQESNAA